MPFWIGSAERSAGREQSPYQEGEYRTARSGYHERGPPGQERLHYNVGPVGLPIGAATFTLSAGTTIFQQNASFGSYIAGGGVTNISDAISGSGALTVQNSATIQMTAANTFWGTIATAAIGGFGCYRRRRVAVTRQFPASW